MEGIGARVAWVFKYRADMHTKNGDTGEAEVSLTHKARQTKKNMLVLVLVTYQQCSDARYLFCLCYILLPSYLFQPTVTGPLMGIATGKSTVAALLAFHDIPIIDADPIARQVVEPGTRAHKQIVKAFGRGALFPASMNPTYSG